MAETDYKHRCEIAESLLAQCDNKFFLVGDYEIRRMDSRWWLTHHGNRVLDFDSPVDAFDTAKDLMASEKAWRDMSRVTVEADPT